MKKWDPNPWGRDALRDAALFLALLLGAIIIAGLL